MEIVWTPALIKRAEELRATGRSYYAIDKILDMRHGATRNKFWRMSPDHILQASAAQRKLRERRRELDQKQGSAGNDNRFTVPPEVWNERDARYGARNRATITQLLLGDPPPGFSALERRT